jgi:hypothetical protein
LGTLIEHIGNQMQHYLGEGKESEEKKKKKRTFANAIASQPVKLNISENHIACITI